MQSFKFNAGSRSIERAVADAIGQGIAQRREADASLPQHWTQLLAKLDDDPGRTMQNCQRSHNDARLASRKPAED